MGKKTVNVSLNEEIAAKARELGVNFSAELECRLAEIIDKERIRRLQAENREATASYNAFIEKHGLPLLKHKVW